MAYFSFRDYGVIGNGISAALVNKHGSIDWACLPFLDSPSHFGALLDPSQGGRFQIAPQGDYHAEQSYLSRTQVLETVFETAHGRGVLTDWMPLGDRCEEDTLICRKIDMIEGKITWMLHCAPSFGYGVHPPSVEYHHDGILFRGQNSDELAQLHSDQRLLLGPSAAAAIARFDLEAGKTANFLWAWGRRRNLPLFPSVEFTIQSWRQKAHRCPPNGCPFAGPWHDTLMRSSLVFKLLCTPYGGSIAEAITSSQPGGASTGRGGDFRFATIRDGALAIQALASLGAHEECRAYFGWLSQVLARDGAEGLQSSYTLDGGRIILEREAMGSRLSMPSLTNRRFQLDIYGHVILAASEYHRIFGELPEGIWAKLAEVADYVVQAWKRPDHGPWDSRARPEHFVYSKLYCWAALDRACSLAKRVDPGISRAQFRRWEEERDILHRTICAQGYDQTRNTFVRAFGDREIDSSSLWIPLLRFLPADDYRVLGTLDAIQTQLSNGVLIYRQRASEGGLGMPSEGANLATSLLFAACLALAGRTEESTDRLAELCSYATPLGFFGEQVDPASSEVIGGFPSAAAHFGLVNAVLYLNAARGRQIPLRSLMGLEVEAQKGVKKELGETEPKSA